MGYLQGRENIRTKNETLREERARMVAKIDDSMLKKTFNKELR